MENDGWVDHNSPILKKVSHERQYFRGEKYWFGPDFPSVAWFKRCAFPLSVAFLWALLLLAHGLAP